MDDLNALLAEAERDLVRLDGQTREEYEQTVVRGLTRCALAIAKSQAIQAANSTEYLELARKSFELTRETTERAMAMNQEAIDKMQRTLDQDDDLIEALI